MNDTKVSKFLSLVLRHKPSAAKISLDDNGWADVPTLVRQISFTLFNDLTSFTLKDLERIVAEDSKGRYSFSSDKSNIRANQGHSISVDVELKEATPPDILYHGTSTRFLTAIFTDGIKKMSRQYVHLSADKGTAFKVGARHGASVVLEIETKKVTGQKFFISENGVWLVDHIRPEEITFRGRYEIEVAFSYPESKETIRYSVYAACLDEAKEHVRELAEEDYFGDRPVGLQLIKVVV